MNLPKVLLSILATFALLFLGLYIYFVHYADHGADGLGGFFMAIICGGLFLICLVSIISILSIILFPKSNNGTRFFIATLSSIIAVYIALALTFLPTLGFW